MSTARARPAGCASKEIGDIRLTLLPDGYFRGDPLASFVGSTPDDWAEHPELLDDHGRVVMTMGAMLAEVPSGERVLLDAGFGPRTLILEQLAMEFWGGRLLSSLAAVGLSPTDIDVVIYSHLHADHVGWTADAQTATATFSRARHVLSSDEWSHWAASPDAGGPTTDDLAVLGERVELVDGEIEVVPGISVLPTPGHTPGHCSFRISSGASRALVLGDAIHCPLQITHPEWGYMADIAPAVAERSRRELVRELETPGTTVVGPHFPDAVFGRVVTEEAVRRVAFDVALPVPTQEVADEAPSGAVSLPPLR